VNDPPESYPADAHREDLLDPDSRAFWLESDLAAICRHQLAAPVQVDLSAVDPSIAPKLATVCGARGLLLRSFGDLLTHRNPPLELLDITRRFAKTLRVHPQSPLPPQVAAVLYYASIVAARVRCQKRITTLDDAELRVGLSTCLSYVWLEDPMRSLLNEGLAALGPAEGSTR